MRVDVGALSRCVVIWGITLGEGGRLNVGQGGKTEMVALLSKGGC